MSDITLSRAIRANLLHLQNTASLMDTTQERLATGKKVNSALDNPTNFFTASSLNARAGDIGTLLDAMGSGIRTIEAADNGLTAITKTIESMQSTLRQARQDRSFAVRSLALDPVAIGTGAAKTLTFEGGSVGATPVSIALNTPGTTPAAPATVTAPNGSYTAPTPAEAPLANFAFAGVNFDNAGDEITFEIDIDGAGPTLVTIDKTIADAASTGADGNLDTIGEYQAALQAALAGAGVTGVTVGQNGSDITLATASTGLSASIAITNAGQTDGGGADTLAATGGIANGTVTGVDAVDRSITINGVAMTLTSANAATAEDAATQINAILAAETPPVAITATGNDTDGTIDLAGPDDGSLDITLGGDSDAVFGAGRTAVAAEPGSNDGAVRSIDQIVTAINDNAGLKDRIRATNDNGKLRIENLSTLELSITGYDSASGAIDGGAGTTEMDGNKVRSALVEQYNALKTQLDRLSEDASFNGVNLLRGDMLKIVFNETATSIIEVQARDADGVPRAINASELGLTDLTRQTLNSDADIETHLNSLQAALAEVRAQSSSLGAHLSSVQNREDFTKKMMNTLETGAANLTLADTNEEAANLLALQTRQQLSQTALSLASQADQAVLRLFG